MRLIEKESYSQRRAAERPGISKTTVDEILEVSRHQVSGSNSLGS